MCFVGVLTNLVCLYVHHRFDAASENKNFDDAIKKVKENDGK